MNRRPAPRWGRASCLWLGFSLVVAHVTPAAPSVSVGAAANLVYALDALHREFKQAAPDVRLSTTVGASGSLFAQIKQGAPFDVFLSADGDYPRRVVADGLGEGASLKPFATGRLVVWTLRKDLELQDLAGTLAHPTVKRIAIAQPNTAPYGRAARAALESLGLAQATERRIVVGESISQTAQFVQTGHADMGFVALSIVMATRLAGQGQWREVPLALYSDVSLEHAAVLTSRGAKNAAARRYLDWLDSGAAKSVLEAHGYRVAR